jgi:hypothetical protein
VDPDDPTQWRYWDGQRWTDHRAPRETPGTGTAETMTQDEQATEVVVVTSDSPGAATVAERFNIKRTTSFASKKSLPTVAEVISQMQLEAPRHPLEEQIEVAGETYHVKGIKRVYAEVGMPITSAGATIDDVQCVLVPEPWNPHDANAVAVVVGTHHVGYVPADMAEAYAAPLCELAERRLLVTGQARIWALDDKGVVRARVTILVPEADAL